MVSLKRILFAITFLTSLSCQSQNLIPNGGFERYELCPTNHGQISRADYWTSPNLATPDYVHMCSDDQSATSPNHIFGYQLPRTDSACAAIYLTSYPNEQFFVDTGYKEYIETSLTDTLVANTIYLFEMYVNLSNRSYYATDDIGVYFSDTLIANIDDRLPLSFEPQIANDSLIADTMGWQLVTGTYTAHGGETHMIIGNFKADSLTSLEVVNSWSIDRISYVFVDDVSLTLTTGIDERKPLFDLTVYPNPFYDRLTISTSINGAYHLTVSDMVGRAVYYKEVAGSVSLNTASWQEGVYVCELSNQDGKATRKIVLTR